MANPRSKAVPQPIPGVNIGEPGHMNEPARPKVTSMKAANPNDPNASKPSPRQAGNAQTQYETGTIDSPNKIVQAANENLNPPQPGKQPTVIRPPQNPMIVVDEDEFFDYFLGERPLDGNQAMAKR